MLAPVLAVLLVRVFGVLREDDAHVACLTQDGVAVPGEQGVVDWSAEGVDDFARKLEDVDEDDVDEESPAWKRNLMAKWEGVMSSGQGLLSWLKKLAPPAVAESNVTGAVFSSTGMSLPYGASDSKGVCGDRSWDETLPWNGRVSTEGMLGDKPFLKYVYDHYKKEKFPKLLKEIVHIKEKTGPKRSGQLHLQSDNFQHILGRVRGYEKCRAFATLMAGQKLYAGTAKKKLLDKNGVSPAVYRTRVAEVISEGDNCCDENCDPYSDSSCVPCGPVCSLDEHGRPARDEYGELECRAEEKYCFERCSDSPACEVQGDCDCSDGNCRPCNGLKSIGRWVAKEMKITMSFDVCGEMEEGFVENKGQEFEEDERSNVERQMCSVFRPSECFVDVAHLIMRGDARNRVPSSLDGPPKKVIYGNQYATVTSLTKKGAHLNGKRVFVISAVRDGEDAEPEEISDYEPGETPPTGAKKWRVKFSDPEIQQEAVLKEQNLDPGNQLDTFKWIFGEGCTAEKLEQVKDSLKTVVAEKEKGHKSANATLEVIKWAELYLEDLKPDDDKDESWSRYFAKF